tara:strand:- start:805 stop:1722 length:918 start_codon:yes stop_codon:yes gene_type:complete
MAETLNLVNKEDRLSCKYEISTFPDGQQSLKIIEDGYNTFYSLRNNKQGITINSRLNSFKDLELIICANQCLKEIGVEKVRLYIPYCIGGRSDRKFEEGGINYIKTVIAPILNSQNFEKVIIMDPHSDVLEACINNFESIDNHDLVIKALTNIDNKNGAKDRIVLVSPDAGALKKVFKIQQNFGIKDIIIGSKNRDLKGNITHTSISGGVGDAENKTFVIVDDICDGGRTFIELAKVIRKDYSKDSKIVLVITHGIFSKGFDTVFEYVDEVYTTNSVNEFPSHNKLTQYDIFIIGKGSLPKINNN